MPGSGAKKASPLQHMVAGVTAGVASTCMLHPLDLIKVRFQAADGLAKNLPTYRNTANALRTIFVREHGRGLYRGLSPAVTGSGMAWGLYFFFYESAKARHLRQLQEQDPATTELSPLYHCAAAFEGSAATVLLTNPVWLVKTRMQLQVSDYHAGRVASKAVAPRYPTMWSSFRWIVQHEGVTGLYRGLVPALFLTSHGVVQFAMYEELKRVIRRRDVAQNPALVFTIGAASKVLASVLTYPAQVLKTRLQQDAEVTGTTRYQGVKSAIARTMHNEGWRGFYKGFAPYLYRGVLSSALTLVVYEQVVSVVRGLHFE